MGGGIRSINDIEKCLRSGADKVAINSYATENPLFIKEAVNIFGSSTILINIEAKQINEKKFHQIIDNFRSPHLWDKINGVWKLKSTL